VVGSEGQGKQKVGKGQFGVGTAISETHEVPGGGEGNLMLVKRSQINQKN